jgi:hypothetical protein
MAFAPYYQNTHQVRAQRCVPLDRRRCPSLETMGGFFQMRVSTRWWILIDMSCICSLGCFFVAHWHGNGIQIEASLYHIRCIASSGSSHPLQDLCHFLRTQAIAALQYPPRSFCQFPYPPPGRSILADRSDLLNEASILPVADQATGYRGKVVLEDE